MAAFIDSMRQTYRFGSVAMKLVFINVAIFVILRIIALVLILSGLDVQMLLMQWVELPSDVMALASRPWTVVTYMFSQYGVMHLLFNMLWLYWFGALFLYCSTSRQLVALYVYGGFGGAVLFIAAYAVLPYFGGSCGWLIGSSAAVLAVVVATAWRMPDYKVGLLFIGEISLKWIAAVAVLVSVISSEDNIGGNIAHLGGALVGAVYGLAMSNGRDITAPFNTCIDKLVNFWRSIINKSKQVHQSAPKPSSSSKNNTTSKSDEETLDVILDKIKKSGYSALTADERKRLFDVSSRIK